MKRISVPENHLAIISKNTGVCRFLNEGSHWLSWGETADIYDMSKEFAPRQDADILLRHTYLHAYIEVAVIPEGAIGMMYINQVLQRVLPAGLHIFWKGVKSFEIRIADITPVIIPNDIPLHILEKSIMSPYVRTYKVEPHEKGVLYIDGKYTQLLEPGTYYWWRNPVSISVSKADIRQTTMEISGQEILTKDKAQIRINFSVQYRVCDVEKALLDNKDFEKQLHNLMQLMLRAFIGRMTLDELMDNKTQVNAYVHSASKEKAQHMGIAIADCGLKDIILPGDVKNILNQVLIAEKTAQANIIMRREETASTRSLLNTAKLLEDNAMLLRLKEMEYIEKIADKINTISVSGNGQVFDQLKQLFVK